MTRKPMMHALALLAAGASACGGASASTTARPPSRSYTTLVGAILAAGVPICDLTDPATAHGDLSGSFRKVTYGYGTTDPGQCQYQGGPTIDFDAYSSIATEDQAAAEMTGSATVYRYGQWLVSYGSNLPPSVAGKVAAAVMAAGAVPVRP